MYGFEIVSIFLSGQWFMLCFHLHPNHLILDTYTSKMSLQAIRPSDAETEVNLAHKSNICVYHQKRGKIQGKSVHSLAHCKFSSS